MDHKRYPTHQINEGKEKKEQKEVDIHPFHRMINTEAELYERSIV